jgi:cyclic pyranopterin monophosphate synthase
LKQLDFVESTEKESPVKGLVDISGKPTINREATASGSIFLNSTSIRHIKENTNPKGDVLENAKLAAVHAVKMTPTLVFLCHPIKINSIKVHFELLETSIKVYVTVKTTDQTGVEIEAVTGVMNALLTIFDVCKRFEKDDQGQYNHAKITDVKVEKKIKY